MAIKKRLKEGWPVGVGAAFLVALVFFLFYNPGPPPAGFLETAIVTKNVFFYSFNASGTLYEAGSIRETTSPYWWLNSGGKLFIADDIGSTAQGALRMNDPWRILYARANPVDTDNGYHPQNIFRLITRAEWANNTEEAYFNVSAYNPSASANRNQSNGLLLFTRYHDGDNLYYAGIRVDGNAVIKKKSKGIYYTMALEKTLPGIYNAVLFPNLIPFHTWIGLRMTAITTDDNHVAVQLFMDVGRTGRWTLVAQATDDGAAFGGEAIVGAGHDGIRTDFMDVLFDDFRVTRA